MYLNSKLTSWLEDKPAFNNNNNKQVAFNSNKSNNNNYNNNNPRSYNIPPKVNSVNEYNKYVEGEDNNLPIYTFESSKDDPYAETDNTFLSKIREMVNNVSDKVMEISDMELSKILRSFEVKSKLVDANGRVYPIMFDVLADSGAQLKRGVVSEDFVNSLEFKSFFSGENKPYNKSSKLEYLNQKSDTSKEVKFGLQIYGSKGQVWKAPLHEWIVVKGMKSRTPIILSNWYILRYLQDMMLETVMDAFKLTNSIYKNESKIESKYDGNNNEFQYINSFTDGNINMNADIEETEHDSSSNISDTSSDDSDTLSVIKQVIKINEQQDNHVVIMNEVPEVEPTLLILPSKYFATNPLTGKHTISIGNGLIAGKDFKKHERIALFNGVKKLESQLTNESVGYVIELPGGEWFLDCSTQAMNGECPASNANSPYDLGLYGTSGGNLTSNAEIVQSFDHVQQTWNTALRASKKIKRNSEILVNYGIRFKYDYVTNVLVNAQLQEQEEATQDFDMRGYNDNIDIASLSIQFIQRKEDFENTFGIEEEIILDKSKEIEYPDFLIEADSDLIITNSYREFNIVSNLIAIFNDVVHNSCEKEIIINNIKEHRYIMNEVNIDLLRGILLRQLFITYYFSEIGISEYFHWDLVQNPSNEETALYWNVKDKDFALVCEIVCDMYEIFKFEKSLWNIQFAHNIFEYIMKMKPQDLMKYFIALNLSSDDWSIYIKYTRHINNRFNFITYNKLDTMLSYHKARETMFKELIQDYDLCIDRDPDRISETYSEDVMIKVPLGIMGFKIKAENQVMYYIIRSIIILFQHEFIQYSDFVDTFGKYYEFDNIEEIYKSIVLEAERFIIADSKNVDGIVNLQTSEIMFTSFIEEKCNFQVKKIVPEIITLFYSLDYNHTLDVWDFINTHLYRDQEWLWEYYFLLTYHRNDHLLNIIFRNMRYHQVIRLKNRINITDKEITMFNVFKTNDIKDYYEVDSKSLPFTIQHKDIIMIDISEIGRNLIELVFANSCNRNYPALTRDDIICEYNYEKENANVMNSMVFDANSPTNISFVFRLIKKHNQIVIIPLDIEAYRNLMFNELCTYSRSPLIRMQQLVIENLFNRHKEITKKITDLLFISNQTSHRNEVSYNISDLDESIIEFYVDVVKDKNNSKDVYNGTMYWSNYILRTDNYITLQEHILKRELKLENMNLSIYRSTNFIYDNNKTIKYNVLQFLFSYGFSSMVYVYFDHAIRYNVYRDGNAGYADVQLCDRDYTLICLELSIKEKPVFLVKHDFEFNKQMDYVLGDRDMNVDNIGINQGWQEAICSLVNRHLHTNETIINLNEFLLYREWDIPNIPNDVNILI